jgi:hypothetical protein
VGSYNVFRNPRFAQYLEAADPQKLLPHFHVGWCTDFCDRAAVLSEREKGYKTVVIIDGVAGVFPASTAAALHEMIENGVDFMTTAEFEALSTRWKQNHAKWNDTLNDLEAWRKTSQTKARLIEALKDEYWKNELPVQDRCPVLMGLGV